MSTSRRTFRSLLATAMLALAGLTTLSGSGAEQLFDLEDDPQELRDLARQGENEGRVQGWRRRMVEALAERPEGFVSGGELVSGRQVTAVLPTIPRASYMSGA